MGSPVGGSGGPLIDEALAVRKGWLLGERSSWIGQHWVGLLRLVGRQSLAGCELVILVGTNKQTHSLTHSLTHQVRCLVRGKALAEAQRFATPLSVVQSIS